jgi:4-alpha-glucanotransferase
VQFAFDGSPQNPFLPHNLDREQVVYTGTHDNVPTKAWFKGVDEHTRSWVEQCVGESGWGIAWDLVRAAYQSVARLAIVPMQDLLDLGIEGAFNVPGQAEGNWQWRMCEEQLKALMDERGDSLRDLAKLFARLPKA